MHEHPLIIYVLRKNNRLFDYEKEDDFTRHMEATGRRSDPAAKLEH